MNLYMLFATYGEVVQVRVRCTQQLRGQAFVVFKEQACADLALSELQNLNIFGSPIVSPFATCSLCLVCGRKSNTHGRKATKRGGSNTKFYNSRSSKGCFRRALTKASVSKESSATGAKSVSKSTRPRDSSVANAY